MTWYKGVRELTYCQRYRILAENDGHFMMQIPSTMKQDSGEFTITASNSVGSAKFTAVVNILPPRPGASPPTGDIDWSVYRQSIVLLVGLRITSGVARILLQGGEAPARGARVPKFVVTKSSRSESHLADISLRQN